MKRLIYTCILLFIIVLLTGCMKYDIDMEIKEDKSVKLSVILAIKPDSNNFETIDESDKKKLEDSGFTIEKYDKDGMNGIIVTKIADNIDLVSKEYKKDDVSIFDYEELKNSGYMFLVKKGIFKNKYTSIFNATYLKDGLYKENELEIDIGNNYNIDSHIVGDINFNLKLPNHVLGNNADTVSDDGKELKWNLLNKEEIQFEFELYNTKTVYMFAGGISILLAFLVVASIKNKMNIDLI